MRPHETRDHAQLEQSVKAGHRARFLFFWGHTPRARDGVDASCLSQWFPARFSDGGIDYATAEHYMMAQKARLFGDEDALARILDARSPGAAKALGRAIRDFDEATWVDRRVGIVTRANVLKFGQSPELGEFLSRTGTRVLVEASPRDPIWGIGLDARDEAAEYPHRWRGLNLLGFALMAARAELDRRD